MYIHLKPMNYNTSYNICYLLFLLLTSWWFHYLFHYLRFPANTINFLKIQYLEGFNKCFSHCVINHDRQNLLFHDYELSYDEQFETKLIIVNKLRWHWEKILCIVQRSNH